MSASVLLLLAITGLVGGVTVLALRAKALFFVAFLTITVLIGLAHYYLGEERAYWLASVVCIVVAAKFFIDGFQRREPLRPLQHTTIKLVALFLAWGTFASLVGGISQSQAILAIKNYFAIWMVALPVIYLATRPTFFKNIEWALILLFALQLPFTVLQNLTTDNWDAIVGTFGGDVEGGGASGTLMIYTIVGALVLISWWQRRIIPFWAAAAGLALAFIIIVQGEVKAFFILMPLAIVVLLRRLFLRAPLQSGLLLLTVAFGSYWVMGVYEQTTQQKVRDRDEALLSSLEYFFDTTSVSSTTGEVSRGASVALWYEGGGESTDRLIGYGFGASRASGTLESGELSKKFGEITINSTTIAQLLWDTGIIGLMLYVSILVTGMQQAMRIARSAPTRPIKVRADLLAAILSLSFPLLIYDRSLVDGPAIHFLLAITIGMLCGLERQAQTHRDHVSRQNRLVAGHGFPLPQASAAS